MPNLRRAMIHGSVVASFCCEGFGLQVTTKTTKQKIQKRVSELGKARAILTTNVEIRMTKH